MIEAVRVIQKLGLKPRRTIRVALWARRGTGPARLARLRRASTSSIRRRRRRSRHTRTSPAYFNLDNGTGRIRGIWGQGNAGAMKIFEQWGEALKDLGWKNVGPRSVGADRSRVVRRGRHSRLPVHPGAPRIQLAHAPLEHGLVDRVQRDDVMQQASGGRGVRVVRGELAGEAAAQAELQRKAAAQQSND